MTKVEYLNRKNEIVFDATGVVLTPNDQICEDGEGVELEYFETAQNYLHSTICPYCITRKNEDKGYCDCSDCPMALAGNACSNYGSTWEIATELWRDKSTKEDQQKMKALVEQYNRELKESE